MRPKSSVVARPRATASSSYPRLILALTDPKAAVHFTGRTWMAQAMQEFRVEVQVVELPDDVRQAVLQAQARQYR